MAILVETNDEFRKRHGDSVYDGRHEFFEDGALIAQEGRSRQEPPGDEAGLLRMRHAYTQAKVDQLVSNFNRLRQNVKIQAEFSAKDVGPPPHPQAIQGLRDLADQIIEWKLRLEEVEKLTPSGIRAQQRERLDAYQQREAQETLNELQKLPVF